MNLTPLKYVLLIENVTTVFRNYLCLKKRNRIIVLLWIFFESINIAFCTFVNISSSDSKFEVTAQRLYFFSSATFSIYVMLASLYYCKRSYNLLLNFDSFYKIFDDKSYNQRMLKTQKKTTVIVLLVIIILNALFTYIRASNNNCKMGLVASIVFQYVNTMSDFRYLFQYYVLSCILCVISEQLKAITRSIDSELAEITKIQDRDQRENLSRIDDEHEKLNKWMKAYGNINYSSYLYNSMFSLQLSIMLLIVTAYYIILLYYIAIITVKGATFISLLPNLLSMSVFLSALFMISQAGQKIQKNFEELKQKISELCVHTVENEKYYKLTKDFLRYVRTRPVRVNIFGCADINMSMLPAVVGFFTTYTVIMLQFNNVL